MRYAAVLALLLLSALLEAGGDAVVRLGLHASRGTTRTAWLSLGALILFAYGCVVNAAPWQFGRLLGVYVVFFFLVAQAIAWIVFHQIPTREMWWGGALIVVGGLIVSMSSS